MQSHNGWQIFCGYDTKFWSILRRGMSKYYRLRIRSVQFYECQKNIDGRKVFAHVSSYFTNKIFRFFNVVIQHLSSCFLRLCSCFLGHFFFFINFPHMDSSSTSTKICSPNLLVRHFFFSIIFSVWLFFF